MARFPTTKPTPRDREWADAAAGGDLIVPADALKDTGYVHPTIPKREHFNVFLRDFEKHLRYYIQRGLPDWDAAETYTAGDVVRYGTRFFVALAPVVAANPLTNLNLTTREWEEKFYSDFGTPHSPSDTTPIKRYRNAAAIRGNGIDRLGFVDGPIVQNHQENWRGGEVLSSSGILEKTGIRWNVTIAGTSTGVTVSDPVGSVLLARNAKHQIFTGGSDECRSVSEPLSMFDDGTDIAYEGSFVTGPNVDLCRMAIGLANQTFEVYGATNAFIGAVIYKGTTDANWKFVTGDGTTLGTPVDSGIAVVASTRYSYRVEWIGASQADNGTRVCNFYINGTCLSTATTRLPNGGGSVSASLVLAIKRDSGAGARDFVALPLRLSGRF